MRCFPITLASATPSPCYRPLAGMRCFSDSPENMAENFQLPSPCGDEVFLDGEKVADITITGLPSPCGDEVFPGGNEYINYIFSYRPLAGMRCFDIDNVNCNVYLHYRPLAGMRCFEAEREIREEIQGYRPLAGMRCFLDCIRSSVHSRSYRPLAGMRCFARSRVMQRCTQCYRPLAGMRCFLDKYDKWVAQWKLPSPCGDEVFHASNFYSYRIH